MPRVNAAPTQGCAVFAGAGPPAPAAQFRCCRSPASPASHGPAALPGARGAEARRLPIPAAVQRGKPDLYSSLTDFPGFSRCRQGEKPMQKKTPKKQQKPQLSFIPPRSVPKPGTLPCLPSPVGWERLRAPKCQQAPRGRGTGRANKGCGSANRARQPVAHTPFAALGTGCVPAHLSWTPPLRGTACAHAGSCRSCK